MGKLSPVNFTGDSGIEYKFDAYELNTPFNSIGAVYIFTKRELNMHGIYSHSAIYIGQTTDLSDRLDNHHKSLNITAHGANCICVLPENDEISRLRIEADLINNYDPPCNG